MRKTIIQAKGSLERHRSLATCSGDEFGKSCQLKPVLGCQVLGAEKTGVRDKRMEGRQRAGPCQGRGEHGQMGAS